ncbi:MAG TPA: TetR/AcrR family transcriptional regulator [Brevundimonas sp.]|jgi:TetR/AcrR family transcriptional repressor of mexJK operon|uniref:TetR/AcrR family transcriptional regulator n=1 Tax=Brevundimonas sp. TaxID=1871086 RepID=UPI002E158F4F|nr:TetR/AcrR family transcriptional regulator [Brevundimonas sp.]
MSDGNLPRRGRPRDASKDEAILVAAGELFMERGYEAASLDAVAQAAGVSKATIYSRFADKDALFRAVLDHECSSVVLPASFVPPPDASVRETLILIADQFIGLVLGDKAMAMHRIIVAECCRAPRVAELFFETAVLATKTRFADWLRQQTAAGRLAVKDPDGAAWRFLGAVKAEAHLRASMGLPPVEPARLRAHVEACADEFCRAHAPD